MVICYGDSIIEKNKSQHLKTFKKFHKKYLENHFNAIHFLPFYPSSSDSGFSVIDHYKIDKRLGSGLAWRLSLHESVALGEACYATAGDTERRCRGPLP